MPLKCYFYIAFNLQRYYLLYNQQKRKKRGCNYLKSLTENTPFCVNAFLFVILFFLFEYFVLAWYVIPIS